MNKKFNSWYISTKLVVIQILVFSVLVTHFPASVQTLFVVRVSRVCVIRVLDN